jgi:reactive intermediate/imine deaminase
MNAVTPLQLSRRVPTRALIAITLSAVTSTGLTLTREPMTNKTIIHTDRAPQAIGTYSQAVRVGDTVYLSGQIPLVPDTMVLVTGDMEAQIRRVFDNLAAVAEAAGGSLADLAKLNVYLTDLGHFPLVNQVMASYFSEPYPARAAIGVAALPKGAAVEMDGVLILP